MPVLKVLDPGHQYELFSLDGKDPQVLTFVKREGAKFPGNIGHHPGTTTQEVLRALIARTSYVNNQISFPENIAVINHLKEALWLLEVRAARTHNRFLNATSSSVDLYPVCTICGHIECQEHPQEEV